MYAWCYQLLRVSAAALWAFGLACLYFTCLAARTASAGMHARLTAQSCQQSLKGPCRPHSAAAAGPRCIPAAVEAALHLCQLPQLDQPGQHSAQQAPPGALQPPAGEPQSQQMDRAAGTRPPGHVVVVTTGRASQVGGGRGRSEHCLWGLVLALFLEQQV